VLSYSWAWFAVALVVGTAVLAIPFLGFLVFGFLLSVPFILAWGGEFLAHDPVDEIRETKQHEFLGRGGPDDPFARHPYDG